MLNAATLVLIGALAGSQITEVIQLCLSRRFFQRRCLTGQRQVLGSSQYVVVPPDVLAQHVVVILEGGAVQLISGTRFFGHVWRTALDTFRARET